MDKMSISDTRILTLDEDVHYEFLGSGCEGEVFAYDDSTAFKIFFPFKTAKEEILKLRKVEALGKFSDPSFLFSLGFAGYRGKPDEGYCMTRVYPDKKYRNVACLKFLKDMRMKLRILSAVDAAVRRVHKADIRIGDLRGGNILIDKMGNPIFCDTDNYVYGDFGFDLEPDRIKFLPSFYNREFDLMDVDKFLLAVVSIDVLFKYLDVYENLSPKFLADLVRKLNVSKEVKNGLLEIFSDADNKPYIGDILKELEPEEKLLSVPKTFVLNFKYVI